MSKPWIALVGRAQAGKDTVGMYLADRHGYRTVAFAEPLRQMALAVNPIVGEEGGYLDAKTGRPFRKRFVRYAEVVDALGYERAKALYPEVRRFLQHLGTEGGREVLGPDVWVTAAISRAHEGGDAPCVFTDCRFENEAAAVRWWGEGLVVRVERPDTIHPVNMSTHASETELDGIRSDITLVNGGSILDLYAQVDSVLIPNLHAFPIS